VGGLNLPKAGFAAAMMFVFTGCQTVTPAGVAQMVDPPQASVNAENTFFVLINQERSTRGLRSLSANARLEAAARTHAQDMVSNNYFSHDGPNGSSFSQRARAAGYTCAAAENIAFGQTSEAELMTEWMNSSGHRRNILLSDARDYGLGRVGNMWVLMLGRDC
jgi:uncharacterized protein YkwD